MDVRAVIPEPDDSRPAEDAPVESSEELRRLMDTIGKRARERGLTERELESASRDD